MPEERISTLVSECQEYILSETDFHQDDCSLQGRVVDLQQELELSLERYYRLQVTNRQLTEMLRSSSQMMLKKAEGFVGVVEKAIN